MLPIFTAEEMQELDRAAIEGLGIPGIVLMETAARGVFRTALDIMETTYGATVPLPLEIDENHNHECDEGCRAFTSGISARMIAQGRLIKIFCGKGNNSGDGLAVARMLDSAGAEVEVVLLGKGKELTGDAKANYELVKRLDIDIIEDAGDEDFAVDEELDLVIDALLGTGIKGAARGGIARAIEHINDAPCPVLAIDIPSGVEGSSGLVQGPAVQADSTATMAALKRGLVFSPGKEFAGDISIVDIGTPRQVVVASEPYLYQLEPDDVFHRLPIRPVDTHKGECGRVFILAGSPGLTGAAAMSAMGCVRSGAGLIVVGTPASCNPILEVKLTEAMTIPLPETDSGTISGKALKEIEMRLRWATVCAIGPGLGRVEETVEAILDLISGLTLPVVIDADGLYALAEKPSALKKLPPDTILTPHIGEFARLCECDAAEVKNSRVELVREKAEEWNAVVLLKGSPTLIGAPDKKVYLNPTGNAGMATGGVGDVLTGVIAALMGQGLSPVDAAFCGAYMHGMAGDRASEEKGFVGLAACDIVDFLPQAFMDFGC